MRALRKTLFDPKIAEHHGRVVKNTGDGALVEFASVVDAVRCADEIQRSVSEQNTDVPQDKRIEFRIGIHVGDIIIADDDIFGDGVNIAVRLEGIAEPGCISISDDAHRQIRGKVDINFEDSGSQSLKNIAEPMRVWRIPNGRTVPTVPNRLCAEPLALPDKPSIAVLPYQNMSGDPDQDYFADGMVDEITTALSRFKSLFVIARNSSFTYKGKVVDIKQVGCELGVRYVLEGSVRKADGRVRITSQLIDSVKGTHLWADRFEGKPDDIFELQDQVTASVVGELVRQVQFAEVERANRKPTANLDAYDCYLRGIEQYHKWTNATTEVAHAYFVKAIGLDGNFALAYAWAGHTYVFRKQNRMMVDVARESAEAIRLARRAIELGQLDDLALCLGGFVLAYIGGELDLAAECISRGLSMNTNLAIGWNLGGWVQLYLGNHLTAFEHLRRAERLSPRDPNVWQVKMGFAYAHFFVGRYGEAAGLAKRITDEFPTLLAPWRIMAVSNGLNDDLTLAEKATQKVLELDPSACVSVLASAFPLRRPEDRERWKEGLMRAGFPQ